MEILTALQWAKKGFIPNEGAKGTKQWTNSFYSAKAVYFKDSEVHEDKDTAKAILFAKRKEYRDVAKKRKEKREPQSPFPHRHLLYREAGCVSLWLDQHQEDPPVRRHRKRQHRHRETWHRRFRLRPYLRTRRI